MIILKTFLVLFCKGSYAINMQLHFAGVEKTFEAVANLPKTICYYTGQASRQIRQKLS